MGPWYLPYSGEHSDPVRGSRVLVRTRRGESRRPHWLLIRHRDDHAEAGTDVVAEETTSVATGRTMEEIAAGKRSGSRRPSP